VVVNWNRRELLRRALDSLMKQQGVRLEIILVDNGSTDGSVEMVEAEFLAYNPSPDQPPSASRFPLTLIRNTHNRGFCAANNQGIAAARFPWVALLNNDAEAAPGWLHALCEAGSASANIGMVASKILVHDDPRRIDKAGHLIFLDGQNRGRGSGQTDQGQFDHDEDILWPDGCAALYRKAMLDEIGGFDEDFFAYADDAELGLRARIAGWRAVYAPRAVVRHRRGATLGLRSTQRIVLIERNRVLLAAKLFPLSLLALNPLFYAARLAAGAWAALLGRGEIGRYSGWREKIAVVTAMLRGDAQALAMLPRMLAKRSRIRRIRKLGTLALLRLLWRYRITLRELSQQAI
jgi:GT2 family glycosyltransferase